MLLEEYISSCKVELTNVVGQKMPDSQYFAIPAISNSKLRLLNPGENGSPEKYQQGFQGGFNSSFLLGSAVHSQVLNPEEISVSDYEGKPSGKLGYFIEKVRDFRKAGNSISEALSLASNAADYYKGKLSANRIKTALKEGLDYYVRLMHKEFEDPTKEEVLVLPKKDLETCKRCVSSILNNYQVKQITSPNLFEDKIFMNEYAFFGDFFVTLPDGTKVPLKIKGKADSIVIDPEKKIVYLNDVKTTSKPIGMFMAKIFDGKVIDGVFDHHHYYNQLFLYLLLLKWHLMKNLNMVDYNYRSNIWAVETTGENKADCFNISQSYLDLGKKEIKELLVRVAWHETYGWDKNFEQSI